MSIRVQQPSTRFRWLGVAALAIALGISTPAEATLNDQQGRHEDLAVIAHGRVATQVNARMAETGTLPDGRHVAYIHSDGNPVSLTVVDIESGKRLSHHEFPPLSVGGQSFVMDDGSAIINVRDGKELQLHKWDSSTFEVEKIASNPVGQPLIRSFDQDDQGNIYGVTYPSAKLFSYDPSDNTFRDYGSLTTDDAYAEALSVVDGVAYVGTGMAAGHLFAVDVATGAVTPMEPPPGYETITRYYKSSKVGDLIAFAFSPGLKGGTNTLFWDTQSKEWACDGAIPGIVSLNGPYTDGTSDGRMFYKAQGEIWEFNSTDCSVQPTGWIDTGLENTGSHRTLDVVEDGDAVRLVGINNDGSFWVFNPADASHTLHTSVLPGNPLTAHSIHAATDGRVYIGTYLGPGAMGRFDPTTGEMETISGPSQADTMVTHREQLVVGSYGNAVVHAGDPNQPWDWSTNPTQLFRLVDGYDQDRIMAMDSNDELVAIGTVSEYGVQGGALTITDLDERRDTYRDLVPAQSVVAVAFGPDGLIYAGTSIRGGLSSPNSTEDAHLIAFDPVSEEVVKLEVPVPGNDVVASLVAVDTSIWGLTNSGHVFEFDTTSGNIVQTIDLDTGTTSSPWGLAASIHLHPDNGLLYGVANGQVFTVNPEVGTSQVLLNDHAYKRMDIADDGTVFIVDATDLYSFRPEASRPLNYQERLEMLNTALTLHAGSGDLPESMFEELQPILDRAIDHAQHERSTPSVQAVQHFLRTLARAGAKHPVPRDVMSELETLGQAVAEAAK